MDYSNFQITSLKKNEIHFYYINTAELDSNIYDDILSIDEKNRAKRFKFSKDKDCFIKSRSILRLLLGSYLELNPKELVFEYTSYGKPFLKHDSELKFNISHSGDMAVFGFVKDNELGVDIEKIKDDFNVFELAQNFFSKFEIESLRRIPKNQLVKAFYRCWTRKEAFIKAEGSGLSFPLNLFSVSLENDDEAKLLETLWNTNEKDNWSLFSIVPNENYIAAVAVRAYIERIYYYDFSKLIENGFNV